MADGIVGAQQCVNLALFAHGKAAYHPLHNNVAPPRIVLSATAGRFHVNTRRPISFFQKLSIRRNVYCKSLFIFDCLWLAPRPSCKFVSAFLNYRFRLVAQTLLLLLHPSSFIARGSMDSDPRPLTYIGGQPPRDVMRSCDSRYSLTLVHHASGDHKQALAVCPAVQHETGAHSFAFEAAAGVRLHVVRPLAAYALPPSLAAELLRGCGTGVAQTACSLYGGRSLRPDLHRVRLPPGSRARVARGRRAGWQTVHIRGRDGRLFAPPHNNLASLVDRVRQGNGLSIACCEYMPHGNMHAALHSALLSPLQVEQLTFQVTACLAALRRTSPLFRHNNLTSSNVLLCGVHQCFGEHVKQLSYHDTKHGSAYEIPTQGLLIAKLSDFRNAIPTSTGVSADVQPPRQQTPPIHDLSVFCMDVALQERIATGEGHCPFWNELTSACKAIPAELHASVQRGTCHVAVELGGRAMLYQDLCPRCVLRASGVFCDWVVDKASVATTAHLSF